MPIVPDTAIQFIPRGMTSTRTIRVASGASDLTLTTGTYALTSPAGTIIDSGVFSNNAHTLILGGSVTLGAGWSESWGFTTSGESYTVRRRVIVTETLDSRMLLVDHASMVAHHAWLAYLPAGWTSWEPVCVAATREILQVVADRTAQGFDSTDLLNADTLFFPALHIALRNAGRMGAALTGSASMQAMADTHEAEARDWMRRMRLQFDDDGDGIADRTDAAQPQSVGFPPTAPIGV